MESEVKKYNYFPEIIELYFETPISESIFVNLITTKALINSGVNKYTFKKEELKNV